MVLNYDTVLQIYVHVSKISILFLLLHFYIISLSSSVNMNQKIPEVMIFKALLFFAFVEDN